MDRLVKGTWIINSSKQLNRVQTNAPQLDFYESTDTAGKAGNLLARLVADEEEIVPRAKVRAFARESGISHIALEPILRQLKALGKVDYNVDARGFPGDVEIYSFSMQDAIETTAIVYENLEPSEQENASIASLAETFELPRYHDELKEELTSQGYSEAAVDMVLKLQYTLELVRTIGDEDEKLYYNEHAFADNPEKIAKALRSLPDSDHRTVQEIQEIVSGKPGYPLEHLEQVFPQPLLRLMEGVGLFNALTVNSEFGDATFVVSPQSQGISIGSMPLIASDVFHKAKILLSCLRFGEIKSEHWRGRIDSNDKMLNIVRKLNRGEWVGPATAIGQDYQLLEMDGVIETKQYRDSMYFMRIRQKEVGLLVQQMLELRQVFPDANIELQQMLARQPESYTIPEHRRSDILAHSPRPMREAKAKLLQAIRT